MEQQETKIKFYDSQKSQNICFSDLYGEKFNIFSTQVSKQYRNFTNYIKLASEASLKKKYTGARFVVVNRNNDYKLSTWMVVKVISKKINGICTDDIAFIENANNFKIPIEDINIESLSIDGIKSEYVLMEDGTAIFKANKGSRIVINDDPSLNIEKKEYISSSVLYYGETLPVRKQKVSIDKYKGNICVDQINDFVIYELSKDDDDQKENEVTIELIDDGSTDISIYDIFFGEDATHIYFDSNEKQQFKLNYKNKESGRLVFSNNENIDISSYEKVYVCSNTIQLQRQRNALNSITTRPSLSQKPLLTLALNPNFAGNKLSRFIFHSEELNYEILTDANREGTDRQREFVQKSLQTPDFMILQGPPGSGKTTAILELICQLAKRGKRILLCASTHVAIDNVLEKMLVHPKSQEFLRYINPVRVGDEYNIYSDCVKEYCYGNLSNTYDSNYSKIVDKSFNLVCGTTIGVLNFSEIKEATENAKGTTINPLFDYLILDEASKTTFSEFLVPAVLCKRWIIVGDVKQLAPYVEKNDLIPTLLTCKPIESKDSRIGITTILQLLKDKKSSEKPKKKAFLLTPTSIEYIDNHIDKVDIDNLVAISSKKMKNIYTITKNDLLNNNYNKVILGSSELYFLIEEGLISLVKNYLNKNVYVLHYSTNVSAPEYFNDYSVLHYRQAFDHKYKETYSDFSRKLEDEILWRLIRLYELDEKQKSAGKYQDYIERVKNIFNEEERKMFEDTLYSLQNMAIPSIIMMLQVGINKSSPYPSIISCGFDEADKENRFVRLDYQHRMHPDISKISRENVYNNEALKNSVLWKSKMEYMNKQSRFEIRDVEGPLVEGNNLNEKEIDAIMIELKEFNDYAKTHKKTDGSKYSIAILTFYNRQVVNLRKELQKFFNTKVNFNFHNDYLDVTLNSVDKFQGQEADIVYLSMVQNDRVGFLDSVNRVNVAITRAKEKIIIFGDRKFYRSRQQHSELLQKLFKENN